MIKYTLFLAHTEISICNEQKRWRPTRSFSVYSDTVRTLIVLTSVVSFCCVLLRFVHVLLEQNVLFFWLSMGIGQFLSIPKVKRNKPSSSTINECSLLKFAPIKY